MSFSFQTAVREQLKARVAIDGPSVRARPGPVDLRHTGLQLFANRSLE